jgi:hypothetical protein
MLGKVMDQNNSLFLFSILGYPLVLDLDIDYFLIFQNFEGLAHNLALLAVLNKLKYGCLESNRFIVL